MNRIFVREQMDENYVAIKNRQKIGIVGMSAGAGASLIATSLAKHLSKEKSKRIAFVEAGTKRVRDGSVYDSLGMDKRFAGRVFYDFYKEIKEGRSISGLVNLDEKINWSLRIPSLIEKHTIYEELEAIEMCRLLNNITADIVICDITSTEDVEYIIREMDLLIFVIDPLPSKLISGYNFLCRVKNYELKGQKIIWLINKFNKEVNKRELNSFIKLKNYISLPMFQQEYIYLSEYNCRIPYAVKTVEEAMFQSLEQIKKQLECY